MDEFTTCLRERLLLAYNKTYHKYSTSINADVLSKTLVNEHMTNVYDCHGPWVD